MKRSDRDFTAGYMVAAAGVARDHGEDTLAEFLLEEAGYTLADAIAVGLDAYDLDPLKPVFREIEDRRRRIAAGRATLPPKDA